MAGPDFTQTGSVSPIPVPIAAGQSVSNDVAIGGAYVVAILIPAAWTAAVITFDAADSSGTWYSIRNPDDSEYVVPTIAGDFVVVDSGMFPGVSNLRVRSGTAAVPVVQVSAVSPILMVSFKESSRGPVASELHLGEVAGHLAHGKQTIPARPANTTAYAANQAYNIAPLTVTAATNANPSVVTVAAHGLVNGQAVSISGAVGNTAINGTWLVANVTANTFTLTDIAGAAVAGNGVWTSGGSLILLLTFPGISRLASARGYITKGKLALDGVAMTGRWRLWLYNILVTPLADQATFTTLKANNSGRIGFIDFSPVTGGSGSDCTFGLFPGASGQAVLEYTADANSAIYGILQALDASTPISGGTAIVELSGEAY